MNLFLFANGLLPMLSHRNFIIHPCTSRRQRHSCPGRQGPAPANPILKLHMQKFSSIMTKSRVLLYVTYLNANRGLWGMQMHMLVPCMLPLQRHERMCLGEAHHLVPDTSGFSHQGSREVELFNGSPGSSQGVLLPLFMTA